MLHAWTCRASAANQSLKNSQDILHHSSVLGKMRPPTWGEQKIRAKIFKKAYNTILQLKGTNCTYHLALSARLLALAAFSLTPLNPVSCVFHQRTREQRFVVCFPLWLCRLFEFNCQAGRCSLFLFFLWCGNQTAVACNMLGELLWLEQTPSCIGIGQCLGGTYKKNLSGGRTLPTQCITCGHEHQNQSKSNNHQSAPLPKTNHIDWTQHSQSPCCLTGPETCFSGQ